VHRCLPRVTRDTRIDCEFLPNGVHLTCEIAIREISREKGNPRLEFASTIRIHGYLIDSVLRLRLLATTAIRSRVEWLFVLLALQPPRYAKRDNR